MRREIPIKTEIAPLYDACKSFQHAVWHVTFQAASGLVRLMRVLASLHR